MEHSVTVISYTDLSFLYTELWCEPVWDSLLCWPPTKASTTAKQRCPYEDGFDTTSKYDAIFNECTFKLLVNVSDICTLKKEQMWKYWKTIAIQIRFDVNLNYFIGLSNWKN